MGALLCLQLRRLLKLRATALALLLNLLVTLGLESYLLLLMARGRLELILYLGRTLLLSFFYFLFFLFVAFEFLHDEKEQGALSCLSFARRVYTKYSLSALGLLWLLSLGLSLLLLGFNALAYALSGLGQSAYLWHIAENIFLNITLLSGLGLLLGACLARLPSRLPAYLLMILIAFLTSPISELFSDPLSGLLGEGVFDFFDLLNAFPPLLRVAALYPFGFSVLPYRYLQIFFWAALFIALLLCFGRGATRRRRALGLAFALLSLFSLLFYLAPSSRVTRDKLNPRSGVFADALYYASRAPLSNAEAAAPEEQRVLRVALDLSVHARLSAVCRLELLHPCAEGEVFTLYHGYAVKEVRDAEGRSLPFEQEGDFITLKQTPRSAENSLLFVYEGASPLYYANTQGIFLPGSFAYYPRPGRRTLYAQEMQAFIPLLEDEVLDFAVQLDSPLAAYSNLPEEGKNRFVGRDGSVSLFAGFYALYRSRGGVEVVYPFLNQTESAPELIESELAKLLELEGLQDVQKIFIAPNMNFANVYAQYVRLGTHIVSTQVMGLAEREQATRVPWYKSALRGLLDKYRHFRDMYLEFLSEEKEAGTSPGSSRRGLYALFDACLAQQGEARLLALCEAYLADDADRRSPARFLQGILDADAAE